MILFAGHQNISMAHVSAPRRVKTHYIGAMANIDLPAAIPSLKRGG